MKFNLTQRLQLAISLPLPQRDSFATFKLLQGLREKLFLSPEQNDLYDVQTIKTPSKFGGVDVEYKWNDEGFKAEFDIEFTPHELKYLTKLLNEMSKSKNFPLSLFDLCDKYFELDVEDEVEPNKTEVNDNNNSTEKP